MKHITKLVSILVLLTLSVFWSCEQNLDDNFAETELSEATFFKTATDFKLFANNYYGYLPAHGT